MSRHVVAFDPVRRSFDLLVEVRDEATPGPATIQALQRRLFARSVRVGLLVGRKHVVVVRDRLTAVSLDPAGFDVARVPTRALLEAAALGEPLEGAPWRDQALAWLQAVAHQGPSILPAEAAAVMVPDVTGHLFGVELVPDEPVSAEPAT